MENGTEMKKNHVLFEESDEEDVSYNFENRTDVGGKRGEELFQLQSRFYKDKRFAMDARFLDDEPKDNIEKVSDTDEQKQQFKILSDVIGREIVSKPARPPAKMMLRYDPSQPQHSMFEVANNVKKKGKEKIRKKDVEKDKNESEANEDSTPVVSKETFYKTTDLQSALNEKQQFSLLNAFGREYDDGLASSENLSKDVSTSAQVPSSSKINNIKRAKNKEEYNEKSRTKSTGRKLWTETLFFKEDDYRLQEGLDFVKHLAVDDAGDFSQTRRNLKTIMKAKIRHNLKKTKPFKRKLGGIKRNNTKKWRKT